MPITHTDVLPLGAQTFQDIDEEDEPLSASDLEGALSLSGPRRLLFSPCDDENNYMVAALMSS